MLLNNRPVETLAQNFAEMDEVEGRSLWQDARRRFLKNRAAVASLTILSLIILFSFFGSSIATWSNEEIDWGVIGNAREMGKPSIVSGHFFGRCLFRRVVGISSPRPRPLSSWFQFSEQMLEWIADSLKKL